MSYLEIAKLAIDVNETPVVQQEKISTTEADDTVDKCYFENLKDSFRLVINDEISSLCHDMVDECMGQQPMILRQHHLKKRDFVVEMTTLLESICDFEVIDYDEDESDDEMYENESVA